MHAYMHACILQIGKQEKKKKKKKKRRKHSCFFTRLRILVC